MCAIFRVALLENEYEFVYITSQLKNYYTYMRS